MSGSETGVITSRESVPFPMGLQNSPLPTQPMLQNMRLSFTADGSAVYKPINPASPSYQPNSSGNTTTGAAAGDGSALNPGINMNMGGGEPMKKKRGRPRKYGPDGAMGLALIPGAAQPFTMGQSSGLSSPPGPSSGGSASPTLKKARGRPRGSGRKHKLEALGSAGLGFTPHVITVKAGEDVSSKIMAFSQHGSRAVCVLSANGAISNVTLRQPATSGGTVTYEGRFEILSLSGSFLLTESGGQRSRTGGLSVSLSGPDGRVLGGGVGGLLIAASPVQVVVGTFVADGRREPKHVTSQVETLSGQPKVLQPIQAQTGQSSPQSRGTLSESSGGQESPFNQQSSVACNNTNMSSIPWK